MTNMCINSIYVSNKKILNYIYFQTHFFVHVCVFSFPVCVFRVTVIPDCVFSSSKACIFKGGYEMTKKWDLTKKLETTKQFAYLYETILHEKRTKSRYHFTSFCSFFSFFLQKMKRFFFNAYKGEPTLPVYLLPVCYSFTVYSRWSFFLCMCASACKLKYFSQVLSWSPFLLFTSGSLFDFITNYKFIYSSDQK